MTGATPALSIALMIESDGPGGGERMLIQLAEELRRRGHRVVPVGPATGCGWLAEELRSRGFEPAGFVLRAPIDPLCVAGLVRLLRRRPVDVVHSHEFTMAVYGAATAGVLGTPHVITMHGGSGFATRWRRRAALRWAFRRSAARVAVSGATRDQLAAALNLPSDAIRLVQNGIGFTAGDGASLRDQLQLTPRDTLLLAVGNLYPVKGHDVLLEALGSLRNGTSGRRWHLAIAGRGDEEQSLRALAARLDIADRVHLLGYRQDIADLLAAADIFVHPSRSEGLPLALLEAMFAGKAIVASDVGGIPEVVSAERDAVLVPAGDQGALASALTRLMSDPQVRQNLATAARTRANTQFGLATMADAYEALYRECLALRQG